MMKSLWTPAEEARLLALRDAGVSPRDLADRFDRSLKAVTNKLKQLRSGAK